MRTVNLQGIFQGLYLDLRLELSLYLIRVSEHRLAIGVNEFHQIASSDSSYTKRIFSHFEGLGSSNNGAQIHALSQRSTVQLLTQPLRIGVRMNPVQHFIKVLVMH